MDQRQNIGFACTLRAIFRPERLKKARGWYTEGTIRVLVALSPRMYREAIALSIHRNRPGLDVRSAPPEEAERELAAFLPHLLVHSDNAPIPEVALADVPCRVEVLYTDSMCARTHVGGGRAEEVGDMGVGGLLEAVDEAAGLTGAEPLSVDGRGAAPPS